MPTPRTRKKAPVKPKAATKTSKARASTANDARGEAHSDPNFTRLLNLATRALDSLSVSHTPRSPAENSTSRQPVHLPTGAQIAETRASIQIDQDELALLDKECEELEQKLERARARRSQLRHEVRAKQASISVGHRIPHDILITIFKIHILENRQSPWLLMHTNKAWRATALSTPSFFARIEIASTKWKLEGYPRHRDGREVCSTVDQFLRATTRARGVPLDLMFNSDKPPGPEEWTETEMRELSAIVHFIGTFKPMFTVDSVETSGSRFYKMPGNILTALSPSSLKSIKIGPGSISVDLFGLWAKTAKNLRSLEFNSGLLMPSCDPKQVWWNKLEHLKIYNTHDFFAYSESGRLHSILARTLAVRSLELENCAPSADDWSCTYPYYRLQRLCLRDVDGMNPVDSPLLRHLQLDHSWLWEVMGGTPAEYPRLAYLEVTRFCERWSPIIAPALHTLVIGDNESKTDNAAFLEKLWPKGKEGGENPKRLDPVILHCRKMPVAAPTLASHLCNITRLEELHLEEMDLTATLINAFAPSKSEVPCQHLRTFEVIVKQDMDVEKATSLIQNMVRSRAKAGFPLQEVMLRQVESNEWLNLLS